MIGYAVVTSTCKTEVEDDYPNLEKEANAHAEASLRNALENTDEKNFPGCTKSGNYTIKTIRNIKGILQSSVESADKWAIFPEIQNQIEHNPLETIPLYKIMRDSAEDRKLKKMLPDLKGKWGFIRTTS